MKLFNQRNPLKKLSAIFGAYIRGDAPDPATSPQGIVPMVFTSPIDDLLKITTQKSFFRAVRLQNMALLSKIVHEHPDAVHWLEPGVTYPQTGLLVAAQHDCPAAAALLCQHGAEVTFKDETGCNALIIAAGGHRTEVVKVLLAQQSPIDVESNLGDTALLAALNYLDRLQMLAETNPDIIPATSSDTIRILIEAGADPAQKNKNGENAYVLAGKLHNKEVFLSVLGANQTRMDNADIQAGKKPVIRIMKPLRLK